MVERIQQFVTPPDSKYEETDIITNYRTVVGRLNTLFDVLYNGTTYKEWTDRFFIGPITELGVGSCYLATADADIGIEHEDLHKLRAKRSRETTGERIDRACLHHRKNIGCILGDLKSPICLHFIPIPLLQEVTRNLGPDFTDELTNVVGLGVQTLREIQHPEIQSAYNIQMRVSTTCNSIDGFTEKMQLIMTSS